jgi:hypothetical protein
MCQIGHDVSVMVRSMPLREFDHQVAAQVRCFFLSCCALPTSRPLLGWPVRCKFSSLVAASLRHVFALCALLSQC